MFASLVDTVENISGLNLTPYEHHTDFDDYVSDGDEETLSDVPSFKNGGRLQQHHSSITFPTQDAHCMTREPEQVGIYGVGISATNSSTASMVNFRRAGEVVPFQNNHNNIGNGIFESLEREVAELSSPKHLALSIHHYPISSEQTIVSNPTLNSLSLNHATVLGGGGMIGCGDHIVGEVSHINDRNMTHNQLRSCSMNTTNFFNKKPPFRSCSTNTIEPMRSFEKKCGRFGGFDVEKKSMKSNDKSPMFFDNHHHNHQLYHQQEQQQHDRHSYQTNVKESSLNALLIIQNIIDSIQESSQFAKLKRFQAQDKQETMLVSSIILIVKAEVEKMEISKDLRSVIPSEVFRKLIDEACLIELKKNLDFTKEESKEAEIGVQRALFFHSICLIV